MASRELWDQVDGDLYLVLGVTSQADTGQLQTAWRNAAKRSHPDLGGDIEEFQSIEIAYQVLSNPLERQRYDRYRAHAQAFASRPRGTRPSPFVTYPPSTPTEDYDDTNPYLWASPDFAYSAPPNRRPRTDAGPDADRAPRNPWFVFVAVMVGVIVFIVALMLSLGSILVFFGMLVLLAGRVLKSKPEPTRRR
ncbi:MAG: DnaJ domain-containing protein [Actinobacteria bacterium]|nr:DnaJ domain-containing protein [Actinomycetota bacterium]